MSEQVTASEIETEAVGEALGRRLGPGWVVFLEGPLGAGKTTLVRGLARGLGCDQDSVSSPTFTIVQEYAGPVPLQHVDLYRLSSAEADDLALDDLMEGSVMAIEWAERWENRPDVGVAIRIERLGQDQRRITIANAPPERVAGGPVP